MKLSTITAGFIPLLDAAPLIVARELGFAEEEGLDLRLEDAPSWSALRDRLVFGQIEAAHMLAPVPVAMALGLGGVSLGVDALQVLSVGGSVIGVSPVLATRMRETGHDFDFADAVAAGQALARATEGRLRIGVPFPFSMHTELLWYWLDSVGMPRLSALDIRTVPPPLMAEAMAAGEIDAFCVGEPWGSIAVETGAGELLLPTSAIWSFAPEKVLAVRHDWAEADADLTGRLMRAVWRAGRWLGEPANIGTASEIVARPGRVDVAPEVLERAMRRRLVISPRGDERDAPQFQEFFAGSATFPWRSQSAWIGTRLALRHGLDPAEAARRARAVFRSDLYRRHLGPALADMPGFSEKVEGGLAGHFSPETGRTILLPNRFFDGAIFDPDSVL
ncbi:ABC transporter substrate-binding protein [Rhodobacter sp. NSM]|uniref:ABC transporter substrate-binding protein n=1 Tax=Rhodobacter sp. NSM TaxID=3457501 RepID=UPI003FCFCDE1